MTREGTMRDGGGQERRTNTVAAQVEVCSVRLDNRQFGVPIAHILEIAGGVHPEPVPLAPQFIGGLVHYRGDVLTTVSLRQLLDLPARESAQDMLVVESPGGSYGLLVDAVGEVLSVSDADFEAIPATIHEGRGMLFAGAYKLKNELMVMLDPAQLDPMTLGRVR